jgi:hypothetical protein
VPWGRARAVAPRGELRRGAAVRRCIESTGNLGTARDGGGIPKVKRSISSASGELEADQHWRRRHRLHWFDSLRGRIDSPSFASEDQGCRMASIEVSAVAEVRERLRLDLVDALQVSGFKPPPDALIPGQCHAALIAWTRLQHRSVPRASRRVSESSELRERTLDGSIRTAITAIREECERGDDLTHRLTRRFYKAGYNDFLFNHFGIHHIHLGAAGVGMDATGQHPMAGGGRDLLFALFGSSEVCFLEVADHDVFESWDLTKCLARIALRNCPELLRHRMVQGWSVPEHSFETAFSLAKAGFTTMFEIDGAVFAGGTVMDGKVNDGKRAACTSTDVVASANRALSMIGDVVEFVAREADALAGAAESRRGTKPTAFSLEVVSLGPGVVVREVASGLEFFHDGRACRLLENT